MDSGRRDNGEQQQPQSYPFKPISKNAMHRLTMSGIPLRFFAAFFIYSTVKVAEMRSTEFGPTISLNVPGSTTRRISRL
jgi:hypothetical protein